MRTIKRQAEIEFNCVELKDAIVLVDLMNQLAIRAAEQKAIEHIRNLPLEENVKYECFIKTKADFDKINCSAVLTVLKQIGFVNTEEYSVDDVIKEHKRHD